MNKRFSSLQHYNMCYNHEVLRGGECVPEVLHHHPPCRQDAGHRLRNPHLLLPGCCYHNDRPRVELGLHPVHAAVRLRLERNRWDPRCGAELLTQLCPLIKQDLHPSVVPTLCLAGMLVLTQIVNPFRTIQFTFKDQFGLAYGGLRGAICFALVFTLPDNINRKSLFVTASIAIIIFTVFIQVRPSAGSLVLHNVIWQTADCAWNVWRIQNARTKWSTIHSVICTLTHFLFPSSSQGISIRPIVEYINIRRTNKDLNTINVEVHTRASISCRSPSSLFL